MPRPDALAHTPGPWTMDGEHVLSARGDLLASCWPGERSTVAEEVANARLMAAAPLMLDALMQWAHAEADGDDEELHNARLSRLQAIAVALGGTTDDR